MLILLALAAGALLRIWFIHAFAQVQGDSLLYAELARNWLRHGVYGFGQASGGGSGISPTLVRLPGYPAFLALCFKLFGDQNYAAILYLQAAIDLISCLLIAAFVRRACSPRAGMIALWLAALCPFTANYVAMPLAETLSIFCVALGFYALLRLVERPAWPNMLLLSFAASYAALLRPDGVLLAVVLFSAWIVRLWFTYFRFTYPSLAFPGCAVALGRGLRPALACLCLAAVPFAAWTIRNWRTFHVFQPLAPRSATDPGDFSGPGFERWSKTWVIEFASTYEIYWNMPGAPLDIASLPSRAFDSPDQYARTHALFAEYNRTQDLRPDIDAQFASLAEERVRAHPIRFYLSLPLLRLADMWLRPRVEMLNIELRWWQYSRHRAETRFAAFYGALNLVYLALAAAGAWYWPRIRMPMLAYILLRSLLLATLAAPEPRYTLECFPILIAFAAEAVNQWSLKRWSLTWKSSKPERGLSAG